MNLKNYSAGGFQRGVSFLKEGLWVLVKCAFFLPSLPWPSRFRRFLLCCFGAKIGNGFVIRSRVNITFPWRLEVGDHVWIGEEVLILSLAPVKIGSNVCISQRAFLCSGSHNFLRDDFALITRPIVIEDSCWIAAQAFIGPGVTVGDGSVVSAGAVVMRNVPERTVARGNPATLESLANRGK